jgi:hypothetical protein
LVNWGLLEREKKHPSMRQQKNLRKRERKRREKNQRNGYIGRKKK